MDIYREKKGKVTMGNFQEIIKVSEGALAWTYLFSENRIGKVSRHWHQGLELTMVLDGEVLYTVNGKHFTAKKGDVVLINIGDYHSCQIDHRPQACEAMNIIFPEEFLRCFSKSDRIYFELARTGKEDDKLKELLEKLYVIFINRVDTPYAQLAVNGVVCEIAYTLFTGCFQDSFDTQIWSEKYKERCKSLTDYIDEHYSEDISLESLSEEFHISRDHLSRIFRTCMGTTFKKHLTRTRMYHAYKLLIHTDLTLLEISMKCGFADSRSFISSFKQVYHTTPSKYRTSLEGISDTGNRAENRKAEFFKDRAGGLR
ncbi:AraC family transcriptional regulator [Enterocloster clostridioformis]|jgi:AraC-like DNA-binding protein/quercetin dioxygenase-like cupin family protein|uniref:AraC family transcriptional regulator n=3 Tax=Lachnospiraceae TaxID=186803 RepID=UPI0009E4EB01|nr:helix-turn-helix domain-containing protein [Enterocloster bolteae]MCC3391108.1 AraC family transcriptional regulator [Enterocloster bolteae]RGB87810.1 AraC family transcriptional regulator [Enterocloster clostridioformis]